MKFKIACWCIVLFAATTLAPFTLSAEESGQPANRIAIVIDDFGNDMDGTKEMMELPIPFTVAIMPFLPTTKRDAELAHQSGREVILHMPMEPVRGKKSWLGPGAITADMTDEQIRERVIAALADVPYAVGINNHMGSKVTASERAMRVVLAVCKERGLFYLDSRTTFKTVVPKVAKDLGVKTAGNDLFFDDVYTRSHIAKQMGKLQKRIAEQPQTVAIGHVGAPGRHTAAVIKEGVPQASRVAKFVFVSELAQ